jgi:hypothetical protein
VPAPENLNVQVDCFLKEDNLSESGSGVIDGASQAIEHRWAQDIERLDQLIGRYLPIAQSAEQDFDRALRASYIVLELIETQSTLLESYNARTP